MNKSILELEKELAQCEAVLLKGDNKQIQIRKADILNSLSRFAECLNEYNLVLTKFGQDEIVEAKRDLVQSILLHSQLDIYSCTNLHKDPWD